MGMETFSYMCNNSLFNQVYESRNVSHITAPLDNFKITFIITETIDIHILNIIIINFQPGHELFFFFVDLESKIFQLDINSVICRNIYIY